MRITVHMDEDDDLITDVENITLAFFGRFTEYVGRGVWRADNGAVYDETTTTVEVFVGEDDLDKIGAFEREIRDAVQMYGEETVLVTKDGQPHFFYREPKFVREVLTKEGK